MLSHYGCILLLQSLAQEVERPLAEEEAFGIISQAVAPNENNVLKVKGRVFAQVDRVRAEHPECQMECVDHMWKDEWCNTACYTSECGYDGHDCDGWCAPDCKPGWPGDGKCDLDCFREECKWDGGDCDGKYEQNHIGFPPPDPIAFDYGGCKCEPRLLNNAHCDWECNSAECNWDSGDCRHQCSAGCFTQWLGDGECDTLCNNESCFFDKGDCGECAPGCTADKIGNGLCDAACMNEKCTWDMGDCAGYCKIYPIDYKTMPFEYNACRKEFIGDGQCDCMCFNKQCKFDGGDCIGQEEECRAQVARAQGRDGKGYDPPY
ncbi:putative notch domain protein [Gregarina niphandrodes]|uniref:Notch domain protein n=1 Tax=Gregarina niphandrodes TaxID=110365 RepID=A0A023B5Y0_GRENI|nr:putative notch domain protein [Gregarina niphandrodes]EZG63631.1 putative notch domain protein [Gregarina niphandrodes]|eukprot:XP_011130671.1 putative notch domain protein [Gregarina niphandrodes]